MCSICATEFTTPFGMVTIDCGHIYHVDCLFRWFNAADKNSCPDCRTQFRIVMPVELKFNEERTTIGNLQKQVHDNKLKCEYFTECITNLESETEWSLAHHRQENALLKNSVAVLEIPIQTFELQEEELLKGFQARMEEQGEDQWNDLRRLERTLRREKRLKRMTESQMLEKNSKIAWADAEIKRLQEEIEKL